MRAPLRPVCWLVAVGLLGNYQTQAGVPADTLQAPSLSVFPIIMYDSDIGVGVGGKGVLRNGFGHREALDLVLFLSSKGEQWYVFTGSWPAQEARQGRCYALAADLTLEYDKLLKSNFFGVGNASEDNDFQFPKELATIRLTLGHAAHPRLIGEAVYRFTHSSVYGFDPAWGTIGSQTRGTGESTVSGVGCRLRWDGRDSSINPQRGWRVVAEIELADPALGSEWHFTRYRLESSVYASVARGHVLAARWWMQELHGTVPYLELSKIGDSWTARGYKADRFLDKAMALSSLEYRFPLVGALGAVLFVDAGRVWPELRAASFREWHVDGGGGLRYYLANFVTRLDFGTSTEGTRIFLQFGQVF